MNKEIVVQWIDRASEIPIGDCVYIPVDNREQRKELLKLFKKEILLLNSIDPVKASKLRIYPKVKDNQMWVVLEKIGLSTLIGFVRRSDGKVERMELEDPSRSRRIKLMAEDGLSLEEAEELEGDLSLDERRLFGDK